MIRVGIIGCGRIADQHATEIKRIPGCELVGVCDKEELMAGQMAERFGVKRYFSDVSQFLDSVRPDVVHLTTPPQSHLELGTMCLDAKANVLFEKPFALNTSEARKLIALGRMRNLKITVGHNVLFSHAMVRMRNLIRSGFLGGPPVHMESIWCYSYNDPGYTKALLGDKNHWVRSLPGKMLHNIISHGISKIAEFLETCTPLVVAKGFSSPFLRNKGESQIIDEVRAIIASEGAITAYFTFSTQISPPVHQFRIYGPKRGLIVDDLQQTVIEVKKNYPYYANHVVSPFVDALQYLSSAARTTARFLRKAWYYEEGRRTLIELFYRSVAYDDPVPISYEDILLTSQIMDLIFEKVGAGVSEKGLDTYLSAAGNKDT